MSVYVSEATNTLANVELLKASLQRNDVVGLMLIKAVNATLPLPVLKAAVDYEIDALRTALYTYYQITP